jgi:hypothetical protein
MRQSAAWGLYLVAGTTAHHACLVLSFLLGGSMVYQGAISAEQLTSFMFYVQMVTSSSLAVCDQYGAVMEVRAARCCCCCWPMFLYGCGGKAAAPSNSNVCRERGQIAGILPSQGFSAIAVRGVIRCKSTPLYAVALTPVLSLCLFTCRLLVPVNACCST